MSHEVKVRAVEWSAECECGNGWSNYRDKKTLEAEIKQHQDAAHAPDTTTPTAVVGGVALGSQKGQRR